MPGTSEYFSPPFRPEKFWGGEIIGGGKIQDFFWGENIKGAIAKKSDFENGNGKGSQTGLEYRWSLVVRSRRCLLGPKMTPGRAFFATRNAATTADKNALKYVLKTFFFETYD